MTDEEKQAEKEARIARLEARLEKDIPINEHKLIVATLRLLKAEPEVLESEE